MIDVAKDTIYILIYVKIYYVQLKIKFVSMNMKQKTNYVKCDKCLVALFFRKQTQKQNNGHRNHTCPKNCGLNVREKKRKF